jgi:hypothetical protein
MSTAVQAAEHVFISVSRFRDLVAIGTISRAPPNGYKLAKVREEYCKNAQAVMQGREVDGAGGLTEQRTRIAAATAVKLEAANALASGKVCLIADVAKVLGAVIEILRENLFAVPARVAEQIAVHSPDDSRAIYKIVERSIYDEMRQVTRSAAEFTAGMAASAAKGETYSVDINPLNLGHADVE